MTKSDLIRKIAALSGVSDSGAKLFFEMFLKELSEFLSAGESLKIENLGYFSLKKGRIKSSGEEKEIDSDIIIFSESENILKNNYLFFLVPVRRENDSSATESFFNLSLNKATVSPDDIIDKGVIIPPDDHELQSILSDKVLNIFIENEKITGTSTQSDLNINEEFKDELKPSGVSSVVLTDQSPVEISEDLANIPFDVSNDVNNLKDEYLNIQNELSDLTINQQANEEVEDWKIEEPSTEELSPDLAAEDEFEKLIKDNTLYDSIEDTSDENIAKDFFNDKETESSKTELNETDILNENYLPEEERRRRRLESLREAGIEPMQTWDVEKVLGEIDKAEVSSIQEEPVIKEETPEELTKEVDENDKNFKEIIPEEIKNVEAEIPEIKPVKKRNETEKKIVSKNKPQEKRIEKKKFKKNILLQLILLIAIFAAAFYYYFNFVAVGSKPPMDLIEVSSNPVIIERDYNIPVTYPYSEERNKNLNTINPVEAGVFTIQDSPVVTPEDTVKVETVIPSSGRAVRIKGHIYKLNDEYLVQIASWFNKTKADEQAALLNKRGFSTQVKEDVAAGDPVFVVIVNHFQSLEEAEEFYNKNQ